MSSLPSQPGVYSFLDAENKILYVGKAKNLKNRVRNYTQINQLSPRIKKLVKIAAKLKFQILDSELEALLIEAELVRLHQPEFNILLKDDKSPIYLHITAEKFPRVLKIRKKELFKRNPKGTILGPFQSSYKLNEVLKIARKIFPWCNQAGDLIKQSDKACFYHHLDLCPGACIDQISPSDYQQNIKNLILFLRGRKKQVLKNLDKKMKKLADDLKFEQAANIKQQIQLIKEVTDKKYKLQPTTILPSFNQSKTNLALFQLKKILLEFLELPKTYSLKRIEGYDVSNISGTNPAVSMVVFTDGKADKKNYRLFNIKTIKGANDYAMLAEAIMRRQNHPEWGRPDLIVVDGGKGQIRAVLQYFNWQVPVIGIAKHPDRIIIPLINRQFKKEIVDDFTAGKRLKIKYQILKLQENHPTLHLIQQIRDESHRFAKKQHSRLRLKKMLAT